MNAFDATMGGSWHDLKPKENSPSRFGRVEPLAGTRTRQVDHSCIWNWRHLTPGQQTHRHIDKTAKGRFSLALKAVVSLICDVIHVHEPVQQRQVKCRLLAAAVGCPLLGLTTT